MAKPVDFPNRTTIFKAVGCDDLPAERGTLVLRAFTEMMKQLPLEVSQKGQAPMIVSCYQMEAHDIDELIRNDGKIYLYIFGQEQPPVYVSPFPSDQLNFHEAFTPFPENESTITESSEE